MREIDRDPGFTALVADEPETQLLAERLRDGRIALGTRIRQPGGGWEPGELHLLEPSAYLDLAAWMTEPVRDSWIDTIRERQDESLRTAADLYGSDAGAVHRLAHEVLSEIPPAMLSRAMILLANSIGPQTRERLIQRLNRTANRSEDAVLRRRLAHEQETFAYVVAAAALFDALERDLPDTGTAE